MHQRIVAVDRAFSIAVRAVVRRRITPNLARQIPAMEIVCVDARVDFISPVPQEEHGAVPLNVHRPEHGADVRETREVHVDVGTHRAHEERGDAVRESVCARLAKDA